MFFIENYEMYQRYAENSSMITANSMKAMVNALYVFLVIHGILLGAWMINCILYTLGKAKYYFHASVLDLICYSLLLPATLKQIKIINRVHSQHIFGCY